MKTYKEFITESLETEWTKNLSDKDMKDHLEKVHAKALWKSITNHEAYSDYHSTIPAGNKTAFQHKVDDEGYHHVRLASTGKSKEHLHFMANKRGKIFTVNHNKVETDSEGNKIRSLIKRYEKD